MDSRTGLTLAAREKMPSMTAAERAAATVRQLQTERPRLAAKARPERDRPRLARGPRQRLGHCPPRAAGPGPGHQHVEERPQRPAVDGRQRQAQQPDGGNALRLPHPRREPRR